MLYDTLTETEEAVAVEEREQIDNERQLILYDDDYHTFDFVIDSLVKVCRHELTQAEQCTYIVHYKGRCSVKKGDREVLKSMCTALLDRGLTADIE